MSTETGSWRLVSMIPANGYDAVISPYPAAAEQGVTQVHLSRHVEAWGLFTWHDPDASPNPEDWPNHGDTTVRPLVPSGYGGLDAAQDEAPKYHAVDVVRCQCADW